MQSSNESTNSTMQVIFTSQVKFNFFPFQCDFNSDYSAQKDNIIDETMAYYYFSDLVAGASMPQRVGMEWALVG